MSTESIWKPGKALKRAFVNLEHGMNDVLDEAFILPAHDASSGGNPPAKTDAPDDGQSSEVAKADQTTDQPVDEPAPPEGEAGEKSTVERITPHTQNRLATFAAFDEARSAANGDLTRIAEALSNVVATHHLSREFLNDCYADIHRSNDLEVQAETASAENRKLRDRLDKLDKQQARYETLVELHKKREGKLAQETETLREDLNTARLEIVESKNIISRTESQQSELHTALAAKAGLAERMARENETLRDKSVNLTLDLEKSVKKQAEIRRKYDDLSTLHTAESANYADMAAKLATAEKEVVRMQKLHDSIEARLAETAEQLRAVEVEANEREKRFQSENQALKAENQSLSARLQASTTEHLDAVSEIAAIKTRVSNLDSEKHLAEKKYAALFAEVETERKQMETALARAEGETSAPDQATLKAHENEVAGLRNEIAMLKGRVKHLASYEKLYLAAKERAREKSEFPRTYGATGAKGRLTPSAMERPTR